MQMLKFQKGDPFVDLFLMDQGQGQAKAKVKKLKQMSNKITSKRNVYFKLS